jgi:hypothetical protein
MPGSPNRVFDENRFGSSGGRGGAARSVVRSSSVGTLRTRYRPYDHGVTRLSARGVEDGDG